MFNKENAADYGRRGGKARAENIKALTVEDRARLLFRNRSPALAQALLEAALGTGQFATEVLEDGMVIPGLTPKEKLQALQLALGYGLGRPAVIRPEEKIDPPETEEDEAPAMTWGVKDSE